MTKRMTVLLYRLRAAVTSTLIILTAATVFASAQGCPNFGFTPGTPVTAGGYPASVVRADFNGDGKADLATANYLSETILVSIGVGNGTFVLSTILANPGNPFSIASGDLNNDGRADLITANIATDSLSVRFGDGTGGFSAATNFPTGVTPFGVYSRDLDSDGDLDLITANYGSNDVSVLLGNGTGGFAAAASYASGQTPVALTFADLDLNGSVDLAVANNVSHTFSVLSGNGNGTFAAATPYAAGSYPQSVATGDFNDDGRPDIVTANSGEASVSVFLGQAGGGFGPATSFAVGNTPFGMAAGDLNSDGNLDLVVPNFFSNNVSVLLGMGNGRFEPAINFPVGAEPASVAVGDLNGDGSSDLALSNTGSNDVSILLNNCTVSTNTAPTIEASAVSRQKGSAASRSSIAAVSDAEDAETDLVVTVNGNGSASMNGVTVSNVIIDEQGAVQADLAAACNASNAAFTLRVTDNGGLFAEATLNVTVTASNAPTLAAKPSLALFPHNGKMREVSMDQMLASVSDDCDADLAPSVTIEQVTSDELAAKGKDKDIVIGADCRSVLLRATRDNQGDGRVYSVRLQVTDTDGNVATAEFKITVPLSPNSGPAIEGPPVLTLGGNCL